MLGFVLTNKTDLIVSIIFFCQLSADGSPSFHFLQGDLSHRTAVSALETGARFASTVKIYTTISEQIAWAYGGDG